METTDSSNWFFIVTLGWTIPESGAYATQTFTGVIAIPGGTPASRRFDQVKKFVSYHASWQAGSTGDVLYYSCEKEN